MSDKTANLIAWIFQPLIVPLYGLLGLWFAPFFYDYAPQIKLKLLGLLAFSVVLIPVLCYWLLRMSKVITTPQAENRRERLGIYLITIFCYLTAGFILLMSSVASHYVALMFIMALSLAVLCVVNLFWKISAHAMGMGGMLSMIFFLLWYYQLDYPWVYVGWILCSGLVCSARLQVGAHTPAQLAAGFFLGLAPLWIIILVGSAIFL